LFKHDGESQTHFSYFALFSFLLLIEFIYLLENAY